MTIEVTAKKVQDAINQGLAQLGATLDEVDVEVIEQGGLFKKAKIKMTIEREEAPELKKSEQPQPAESKPTPQPTEKKQEQAAPAEKQTERQTPHKKQKPAENKHDEKPSFSHENSEQKPAQGVKHEQKPRKLSDEDKIAAAHALEFVKDVLQRMGFEDAQVSADENGELISVAAKDGDDSLIIGRHGETLSALSYLAETCARAEKAHVNIIVDCNGYRDRRAASLTAVAKRRANECVQKRRKIKLEPMERIDRRTIHNALTGDNRVTTASEGKEPHRYVVIIPNK